MTITCRHCGLGIITKRGPRTRVGMTFTWKCPVCGGSNTETPKTNKQRRK